MNVANTIVLQFSTCRCETRLGRWFPFLDPSWQIRVFTHSPFSHVDLVWDEQGNLFGASDSPNSPVVAGNPRGVALRTPDYQCFRFRRRAAIRATERIVERFRSFCWDQLGKEFDHGALSPRVWLSDEWGDRNWRNNEKWFCAELMASAVEISSVLNYPLVGIKNRITASDLLLIINPVIDVERFWEPVVGLTLHEGELP